MNDPSKTLSDAECEALFLTLFPHGFASEDVLRAIAPGGYESSPLAAVFHHFYMGTIRVGQRADLTPVYGMIFRRLLQLGLDWVYHFPRLYAVDFRPLKKALDESQEPDWTGYDPSEAIAQEAEEQQRDRQLAEFRESLDEGYREAVEAAQEESPPTTVRAYQSVYGRLPHGWPYR